MRDLGWNEGADYVIVKSGVFYGALPPDDEERAARRAVEQQPDVILALTGDFAVAAQRLTASVPIVEIASGYPVEGGLALSLAHPSKNVTGNSQYAGTDVWGKFMQFLTHTTPDIKRIAVLWGHVPPYFSPQELQPCYDELSRAERSLQVTLRIEKSHARRGCAGGIGGDRNVALRCTSRRWDRCGSTGWRYA